MVTGGYGRNAKCYPSRTIGGRQYSHACGDRFVNLLREGSLSVKASPNATFPFCTGRCVSTGGLEGDVRTWMLLCSELRGYVLHPEYYFESDDAAHRKAADMLMLTQGWRRYDWRVMSGMEPFELSQPVENQLYAGRTGLSGT